MVDVDVVVVVVQEEQEGEEEELEEAAEELERSNHGRTRNSNLLSPET